MKTAPATDGGSLLIAAHGETGCAGANAALLRLSEAVRERLPGWRVAEGVLNGKPRLEEAFARLHGPHVTVYPLFMSDGYYVRRVLPPRLGLGATGRTTDGRRVSIAPALGTDCALVRVAADRLASLWARHCRSSAACEVLVIAHGSSKSDRPRLDTERFAAALRRRLSGASVRTAYLEEPPFASGAVDSLSGGSVVVSFFAGEGAHATGDLPAMLARAGMAAVPVIGPLGAEPGIAGIVAAAARASPEIVGLAGGPSSASARPASAM